jgi:hypothetical protein
MNDPIVEEVRYARMVHTKKFNYDLSAICIDLRKIQKECAHKVVRLQPTRTLPTRQIQRTR